MTTTAHKFLQLTNHQLGTYNSWDVRFMDMLVPELVANLKHFGQWDYYVNRVEPFQTAVLNMARRGLLVDRPALNRLRHKIRKELEETDRVVIDADPGGKFGLAKPTPRAPNSLGSPKKMRPFLFEHLGLKPARLTEETDEPSLAQDALMTIFRNLRKMDEPVRPILEALFHRSRLRTIYQRYLNVATMNLGPDDRSRPRVKMASTKSFRLAYSEPALHQWPEEIRHVIVSRPGYLFVTRDYKQVELRIEAYLYGDQPTIDVFESGADIHRANMADLLGYSDERIDGMSKEALSKGRHLAKATKYRMAYKGTMASGEKKFYCPCPRCVDKVPPMLELSPQRVTAAEKRWMLAHPMVGRGQREVLDGVRQNHYYDSPFGARRIITSPITGDLERELANIPMQMGAALLMEERQTQLDQWGAPVVLNHHDSLMLEVPEPQAELADKQLREAMEAPVPALGGVSFPTDGSVGRNWGKHGSANPDGLREIG